MKESLVLIWMHGDTHALLCAKACNLQQDHNLNINLNEVVKAGLKFSASFTRLLNFCCTFPKPFAIAKV